MRRALPIVLASTLVLAARLVTADDASDAKMAEEQVALVEKLAAVIAGDRGTCDKMGTDIEHYLDANGARFAAIKKWSSTLSVDQKKAIDAKYGARLRAATGKMVPAIASCAASKSVADAVKRLPF